MSNGSSSPGSLWEHDPAPEASHAQAAQPSSQTGQVQTVNPALGVAPIGPSPGGMPPPATGRPHLNKRMVVLLVIILLGALGSLQLGLFFGTGGGRGNQASSAGHSTPTSARGTGTAQSTPVPSPTPVRVQTTPTPVTGGGQTPGVTPTQPVTGPSPFVAQDTFARPDQVFWGVASDGQTWGGDANSDRAFSITDGTARIAGGQGYFTALLGPQLGAAGVQFTGSISSFEHSLMTNMGAVLRWRDENNYYKAYLDGQSLVVMKRVAGTATALGAVPLIARGGVAYTLRFRAVGSQLFVMAWPAGGPEPVAWMLVVTDHSLQVGFGGLRVLLQPGVTVQASAFLERSLS